MERQTCVDCGRESPPTETSYTLIGSQFGWRLVRAKTDEGQVVEWRCPSCWRSYKRNRPGTITGGGIEDRTTLPPPASPRGRST